MVTSVVTPHGASHGAESKNKFGYESESCDYGRVQVIEHVTLDVCMRRLPYSCVCDLLITSLIICCL